MYEYESRSSGIGGDPFSVIICLIAALAGALVLGVAHEQKKGSIKIEATISRIEDVRDKNHKNHKAAYVNYTYNDEVYKDVHLGYYKRSMKVGKEISIRINSNNPRKIYATSYLALFGGFFFGMGILGMVLMSSDGSILVKK